MIFKNKEHEIQYRLVIRRMNLLHDDPEREALAYLLTLNEDCRKHINDLYDFEEKKILVEGLDKAWQTHTSLKTARMAFNLYNGYCYDGQTYKGSDGYERDLPSEYYSPVHLFACNDARYFLEAIKIRYPDYTDWE